MLDILRRPDPVREPVPGAALALPGGALGIRATHVVVRYPGSATPAFDLPSLEVAPGTRAIVTGPSGSGKSTLAAALLRFLDPASGAIEVVAADGTTVDLQRVPGDAARMAIGLCEQDPHIFDASVADNLRLARPGASVEALEEVQAWAGLLGWVRGLPDGLETQVGEHGARLSGGQRQRLALARALLADVRIFVLDEPTEHLDEPAARAFVADLPTAGGRTLLVLTHRPELFAGDGWVRGADLEPAVHPPGPATGRAPA